MININKLQSLSALKNATTQTNNENKQLIQQNKLGQISLDKLSFSHRSAISMQAVYQSVSDNLPSSFKATQAEPELSIDEGAPLFDFEKVAQEVLSFVNKGISAAKHRGASNDELENMFEQAKVGVTQGIEEATEELDKLSLLTEDIKEGISKSKELIDDGIEELHTKFFPTEGELEKVTSDKSLVNNLVTGAIEKNSEQFAARSQNSDINIVTADGDKISISFSQVAQYSNTESFSQSARASSEGNSYHSTTSLETERDFSFSIEGELDELELAAIDELISNISKLQTEFFDGDIEKAYEQAKNLGFDDKELASFSLNLQKTETSYVSRQYQNVADLNQESVPMQSDLKPLFDFIGQLDELRNKVDSFFESNSPNFDVLFDAVFDAQFGKSENQFEQIKQFISKF